MRLHFLINNVFKILSQELDDSEQYSSPVDNCLAKMVTKIRNSRLPNDKHKARRDKFLRPENIEALCVKKCSEEIWSMWSGRIGQFRAFDLKLQGAQGTQIKATLPIVWLANNLLSVRDGNMSLDTEAVIQDCRNIYCLLQQHNLKLISTGEINSKFYYQMSLDL